MIVFENLSGMSIFLLPILVYVYKYIVQEHTK